MIRILIFSFLLWSCWPELDLTNPLVEESELDLTNSLVKPRGEVSEVLQEAYEESELGVNYIILVDYLNHELKVPVESIISQEFYNNVYDQLGNRVDFFIDFEVDPRYEKKIQSIPRYRIKNQSNIIGQRISIELNKENIVFEDRKELYFKNGPPRIEVTLANSATTNVFSSTLTLLQDQRIEDMYVENSLGDDKRIFFDYSNYESLSIPVKSVINKDFFSWVSSQVDNSNEIIFFIDLEIEGDHFSYREMQLPRYRINNNNLDNIINEGISLAFSDANTLLLVNEKENFWGDRDAGIKIKLSNNLTPHVFTTRVELVEQDKIKESYLKNNLELNDKYIYVDYFNHKSLSAPVEEIIDEDLIDFFHNHVEGGSEVQFFLDFEVSENQRRKVNDISRYIVDQNSISSQAIPITLKTRLDEFVNVNEMGQNYFLENGRGEIKVRVANSLTPHIFLTTIVLVEEDNARKAFEANNLDENINILVDYLNFESLTIPISSIINEDFFNYFKAEFGDEIRFDISFEMADKHTVDINRIPQSFTVNNLSHLSHEIPLTIKNSKATGTFQAPHSGGVAITNARVNGNQRVIDDLPIFYFENGPVEIKTRLLNSITEHVFTNVITIVEQYRLPYLKEKYPVLNSAEIIAQGEAGLNDSHIRAIEETVSVTKQIFHFPAFRTIVDNYYNLDPKRTAGTNPISAYKHRIYNITKNIQFRRVIFGHAGYAGIGGNYIAVASWAWKDVFTTFLMQVVIHEYGHTLGYNHSENITYGFSDFLVEQFYPFMKRSLGNRYTGYGGTEYWYDESDPTIRRLNDALKNKLSQSPLVSLRRVLPPTSRSTGRAPSPSLMYRGTEIASIIFDKRSYYKEYFTGPKISPVLRAFRAFNKVDNNNSEITYYDPSFSSNKVKDKNINIITYFNTVLKTYFKWW